MAKVCITAGIMFVREDVPSAAHLRLTLVKLRTANLTTVDFLDHLDHIGDGTFHFQKVGCTTHHEHQNHACRHQQQDARRLPMSG